MQDQRRSYFAALEQSDRPRAYWAGPSPEDPAEWWYFETVEDDREIVAIRQVTVEGDGQRHRYSADHLEDGWGFLTDQPLAPDKFGLPKPSSRERFIAAWEGLFVHCPRCGDVLRPMGDALGCARGGMELSRVVEAALIAVATDKPSVPERRFDYGVGGTWHCPADGTVLVESGGTIGCRTCERFLPPGVVYQLVELHAHATL